MDPDNQIINKLINSNSLKNFCSFNFLERHNFKINLNDFICYTIGNSNGRKYVNCFKFLGQNCTYKLKNYYIKWWNTGTFETIDNDTIFESIEFWIHSGMTLRKNFFNYDDRMSLFRTTFIYDSLNQTFFRLSYINCYLFIPELDNFKSIIFSKPQKYYINDKNKLKNKKIISHHKPKNLQLIEIQKKLRVIISNKSYRYLLKSQHNKLFDEIQNFINL